MHHSCCFALAAGAVELPWPFSLSAHLGDRWQVLTEAQEAGFEGAKRAPPLCPRSLRAQVPSWAVLPGRGAVHVTAGRRCW